MITTHRIFFAFCFASILLINYSCLKDKNQTKPIDNQTTSSQDNAMSQNIFDDMRRIVEEAAVDEGASSTYSFGSCVSVSINPAWIDTITWPKVMTIDFGTTNCIDNYGVKRRGKLVITLTGRYVTQGSVLTVQPQNYYFNDHLVEGTKTITNNGRNSSNNLSFTVQVSNGKITFPTTGFTTWSSARTNEWIAGESTTLFTHGIAGICDDVYLITGAANGINRNGLSYTVNITSPLRKEICCRWIVSGVVNVTPSGLPTRIVDFGTGTCDNNATVTISGYTFPIYMN